MELVRLNKDNVLSGNNIHSGVNTFSGNNIHSGVETFEKTLVNLKNVGTVGAATVVAEEFGDGMHHITKLTFTNFVMGPLAGVAAAKTLVPPTPLYTLPAGAQIISASKIQIALTAAGTAVTPKVGLGSVVGDGSVNATLAGATQKDIHDSFDVATTLSHATVASGPKTATAGALTGIALNKSSDAKTIYLNSAGTWNANNTGNLTAAGVVVIVWDTLT